MTAKAAAEGGGGGETGGRCDVGDAEFGVFDQLRRAFEAQLQVNLQRFHAQCLAAARAQLFQAQVQLIGDAGQGKRRLMCHELPEGKFEFIENL